ncbi:MAG: hypothetical protein JXR84_28020 [Anaerolineae bacterium]|nr:hypothetical protein [Anaerolineae bacterium]
MSTLKKPFPARRRHILRVVHSSNVSSMNPESLSAVSNHTHITKTASTVTHEIIYTYYATN